MATKRRVKSSSVYDTSMDEQLDLDMLQAGIDPSDMDMSQPTAPVRRKKVKKKVRRMAAADPLDEMDSAADKAADDYMMEGKELVPADNYNEDQGVIDAVNSVRRNGRRVKRATELDSFNKLPRGERMSAIDAEQADIKRRLKIRRNQ